MIHGYARVSTPGQDPAGQVAELERHGVERLWVETGSGTKADRPVLIDLLAYARPGDVLMVTDLSRLSRSVSHTLMLSAELQDRGVELRSLRDAIDTSTPVGRFYFTVMAALAELQHAAIRESQERAWAAGKPKGRPSRVTAAQSAQVSRMAGEGVSQTQIAELLGMSRATVQRVLAAAAVEQLPPASWVEQG